MTSLDLSRVYLALERGNLCSLHSNQGLFHSPKHLHPIPRLPGSKSSKSSPSKTLRGPEVVALWDRVGAGRDSSHCLPAVGGRRERDRELGSEVM